MWRVVLLLGAVACADGSSDPRDTDDDATPQTLRGALDAIDELMDRVEELERATPAVGGSGVFTEFRCQDYIDEIEIDGGAGHNSYHAVPTAEGWEPGTFTVWVNYGEDAWWPDPDPAPKVESGKLLAPCFKNDGVAPTVWRFSRR